jgi:hypothetical protein
MATIDELHTALGEFLTASSRVENIMFSILIACEGHRDIEDVFTVFSKKPFGPKIEEFKEVCDRFNFSEQHRVILDDSYIALDRLLPKRNNLVHGETISFGPDADRVEAYRIGITKGNFNYLNEAVADPTAPHCFTVVRIRETILECYELRDKLVSVASHLFQDLARRSESPKS